MSADDRRQLLAFRLRYPGLTWDQLGALFGVTGHIARHAFARIVSKYVRSAA
jgi:hypothetical protein